MHSFFNKDYKHICTMSVLYNTQKQLFKRNALTPPLGYFMIIKTGIQTILAMFLILLVVSIHIVSKMNRICDNIHCTYYFRQSKLLLFHWARRIEHSMLFVFPSWDFDFSETAIWHLLPCFHCVNLNSISTIPHLCLLTVP